MRENLIEGAVGPLNIMRMVMKMENIDEKAGRMLHRGRRMEIYRGRP